MSNEVELKFEVDTPTISLLIPFFNQYQVMSQAKLALTNSYYDTKDNFLRNNRSSLRIRGTTESAKPTQYEITVKSGGNAIAGLHQRNEMNVALPSAKLDLTVLPSDTVPIQGDIATFQQNLIPLFTTHFNRQVWLISYKQSEIEIALDQGTIACKLNGLQLPIQEIELELKTGTQSDLLDFALELSQFKLHLFSQSKAGRGYRLYNHGQLNKQNEFISADKLTDQISQLLLYWQNNEEYALANNDLVFYQQVIDKISVYLNMTKIDGLHVDKILWIDASKKINSVKEFAFSSLNTQLKLALIHWLINFCK
ncbi:CYTH domain-containing protein [Orbaceae bacterium ac157xtp]